MRDGDPEPVEGLAGPADAGGTSAAGVCSACPYCGVGCGVIATPDGVGGATIAGDPAHPANLGALCVKGAHLGDTLGLQDRLLSPRVDGGTVAWDAAIARTADAFADAIRAHGPDSVAFYVSGQLLTEDYYVANKLMKGFIGSANIDTNSRLCMASSVAGHKRAFGGDVVPGVYEDFETADVVVLVGSNLAWCHPVLAKRLTEAKAARPSMTIVNVDPRRTATSALADRHLGLAPGSDVALFNGLLSHLAASGRVDARFVADYTGGLPDALAAAAPMSLDAVAAQTALNRGTIEDFYRLWADTPRVVTVYSQGVNQWSSGVDKVNAILNCHLATGRIGRPGCGPFSVTGQPNAMGGREVGGLSNMLAAHMALEDPAHRALVRDFWDAPRIAARPGLKAVDLFQALGDGRIKALWVMATNPAVSMPDANAVRAALSAGAFVAVSDVTAQTDTAEWAKVLFPATAWGEKNGTVTNSDRTISRQRAFLPSPGAARPDWRIVCDVAAAIGDRLGENWRDAFSFGSPAEIFREHAALSGIGNHGARAFDISAYADMTADAYDALRPFRWPAPRNGSAPADGRLYAEGGFQHPDGRARLIAVTPRQTGEPLSDAFPLILNTGRVRDHWHTMTRTAKSARLSAHIAEPFLELHPADAADLGVGDADLVRVVSALGSMTARALVTDRQRQGAVFAPMHWTAQTSSAGRVDALVAPLTDPISGQPESKRTPVRVERLAPVWQGFAVTRSAPRLDGLAYWAKARTSRGWRVELADFAPIADLTELGRVILGISDRAVEPVLYEDPARGVGRVAFFGGDQVLGALFVGRDGVVAARDWLASAIDADGAESRTRLLAGRGGGAAQNQGPVVCVCHSVGAGQVAAAIAGGAVSVEAIGQACAAGTNCGSCRPELKAMLAEWLDSRAAVEAAE